MRVLISSTSGYGHLFPMVPLARALLAAGHDMLWATGADACQVVARAGFETAPAGLTGQPLSEQQGALSARAAALPGPERAGFVFPAMFGETFTPPMVADLLPLASRWQPDLMVHEQGELASPLVGAVLGVPSWTHSFGGAVPATMVAEAGRRVEALWAQHGLPVPPYAGCYSDGFLDICPRSVQSVSIAHIEHVQPLRPVADTGAGTGAGTVPGSTPTSAYLSDLDDDRPLVYVTLGTLPHPGLPLGPLVTALADLPVRVLVAVGPHGDPAAFGPQPAHVRVERWVDQPLVLQRCSVVVSHGGSGTFLGTLACGVPQLCLPQAADQFRNAEGGVRSGAALALMPPQATPQAVVEAVARLLVDEEVREGARSVAAEIDAMPSPADVADVLARSVA